MGTARAAKAIAMTRVALAGAARPEVAPVAGVAPPGISAPLSLFFSFISIWDPERTWANGMKFHVMPIQKNEHL